MTKDIKKDTPEVQHDHSIEDLLTGGSFDEPPKRTIGGRIVAFIKLNLFAGIVVLAPLVVTLWLFKTLVIAVDNYLLGFIPAQYHLNNVIYNHFNVIIPVDPHGLGLLGGVVFLVIVGLLVRNIFGRTLLNWGERVLSRIPGVSAVYNSVKQITETITASNSKSFRKVVMVEYPREGIWAVGFVSGTTQGQAQNKIDKKLVNVFLPTTPNPTSGFLLFFPEEDLIELDMTVDQGLKMIISAGIVTPTKAEGLAALKKQKQAQAHAAALEKAEAAKADAKAAKKEPKQHEVAEVAKPKKVAKKAPKKTTKKKS